MLFRHNMTYALHFARSQCVAKDPMQLYTRSVCLWADWVTQATSSIVTCMTLSFQNLGCLALADHCITLIPLQDASVDRSDHEVDDYTIEHKELSSQLLETGQVAAQVKLTSLVWCPDIALSS